MKKTLLILILLIALFTQGGNRAHAGAVIGSTFPQQIVDLVEQLKILYENNKTAIATAASTYKSTVMDAVGNALIVTAQQAAADDIIRWANGGFQGTPSLISNPEGFIKSQGLNPVRDAIIQVDKKNPFGYTVMASIVSSLRDEDNLKLQLAKLSMSELPAIAQKSICADKNLSLIARQDVMSANGTVDPGAYITRKNQLYTELCLGNPATDPALAAKLTAVSNQKPEVVGLDSILVTASGQNDYAKGVLATELARKSQENAAAAAKADRAQGDGVISQTRCKTWALNKDTGKDYCQEEEVVTPSGLVKGPSQTALTSGIDRLTNIQGDGVLSRLLTAFATGFLTRAMSGSVASPGNYNTSLTLTTGGNSPTNTSVPTGGTAPFVQNLINDPLTKKSLIDPLEAAFKVYEAELNELDALDTPFLAQIDAYEIKVDALNACYNELTAIDPLWDNRSDVINGRDLAKNRQVIIDAKRDSLTTELLKIAAARQYINDTRAKLNASNSSTEIAAIFDAYKNGLVTGGYPTTNNIATRRGEIPTVTSDVKADLAATGPLSTKLAECQALPRVPVDQAPAAAPAVDPNPVGCVSCGA